MPIGLFEGSDPSADTMLANNKMLHQVARLDWSNTPVGALDSWPDELRSVCRTVLLSSTPMTVLLGRKGICVFNDAVLSIFGAEAESALGKPVGEALPQAVSFYDEMLKRIFSGRSSSFHDVPLELHGAGPPQKSWFDLDFTPIVDARGRVLGALVVSIETTARVQALLDLRSSRERLDLALEYGGIVGTWELDLITNILRSDERYARLHGVDPELAKAGADDALFVAGIHPDEVDEVLKIFEQAKIDGTYRCQHRVVGPDGTRWILCSGRFRYGPGRVPLIFSGIAVDVTEQVETAEALAESEKRFRAYAETLPHVIFSCDREGRTTYANRRWYEFTGLAESDPLAFRWEALLHPDDRSRVTADWRHAIEVEGKYDTTSRVRSRSGDYRWMRAIALPIRNDDGVLTGWIGTLTDIHDAKLLEVERELVSNELDHRIKNFFALAQGLVGLTAREHNSVEAFAERLRGRLAALHQSHSLVRSGREAAGAEGGHSLHGLIRQLLAPYEVSTAANRVSIEGEDLLVAPEKVTAFALVFHELATNAAKYGALRTPDGTVQIRSSRSSGQFKVVWKEKAPAPFAVDAGADRGFGSRLLSLTLETQLNGRLESAVEEDGLRISIRVPDA